MMITPQGQVKLMDFGIARVMYDPSLTQTHQTTGSLYYMSPEQINGAALDGRSDLYSLAISLYEMVTGRRPFEGENTFAIMAAHMQQAPVPPVQHDPRVPAALSDVILTGMGKDPNSRFQMAADFRAALGRVLEGPVAASAPVYAQEPAQTPAPMKQGMAPRTVYMLAGSLATVAVFALLVRRRRSFSVRTRRNSSRSRNRRGHATAADTDTRAGSGHSGAATAGTGGTAAGDAHRRRRARAGFAGVSASIASSRQPTGFQRPVDEPAANPPAPQRQAAPAVPAVDRAALDEQRRRVIQMAQRIVTAKAALDSLRESMAQQGLRPRAELQGSSQRMQFEMDQAEASLKHDNAAEAKQHLDYAERALESRWKRR